MPGKKELEYLREELSRLGDERAVTAARGETYEELPGPPSARASAEKLDVDSLLSTLGSEPGAKESPKEAGDLTGFDDLLASLPLEKPAAPPPVKKAEPPRPAAARPPAKPVVPPPEPEPVPDFDQGLVPEDLLAGFADDIESSRDAAAEEAAPSEAGFPDFDLASLDLGSLGMEPSPEPEALADLESFSVPEEASGAEIGGMSMPESFEGIESFGEAEPIEPIGGDEPSGIAPEENLEFEAMDFTPSFETPPEAAVPEPAIPDFSDIPELSELSELSDFSGEAPSDAFGADAFSLPEDLSSSFGEAGQSGDELPLESVEEIGFEMSPEAIGTADALEGMEPIEGPSDAGEASIDDLLASFGASSETGSGGQGFDDFGMPGLEGEVSPFGESADAGENPFADVRVPNPDFGSGPAESGGPDDFSNFTIPDDLAVGPDAAEESGAPEADGFDSFSLDEEFIQSSIAGAADEEFHIPGYSDFNAPSQKGPQAVIPADLGAPRRGAKKEVPLSVSESDFRKFLDNLASLPLNLRVAIEEFIAGDSGTEIQKMELVHSVLGGVPVKKIARTMEDLLSRSIPIPKDFEKKSVEEYEREKSSLKYVLMNRILPAATLFGIVATLFACVIILGKTFIYEPLVAESLYRSGYEAIEDARYTQSLSLFDEAVRHVEKKKWYFRYARAYRAKKQYITAEMMYVRLLDRYHNDKAGGLEYAEMLRTDLRNFAKAESVIRRRVLDNYVNDPDGLLLLGDNYLDWADEDASKYEFARKTYATLIELYGSKDPYLARMMRFFIRTDKLAEVLPLKEHFMEKRAKLGAADLVELSGYLLDKRYHPKPGDSEVLIARIEDVRALLERAVKADPRSPEANYNIGRFFLYNYKDGLAAKAFGETIRLFDEGITMSPRRVLTWVDSYRLLGEIQVNQKDEMKPKALETYGKGIALYEEQRANRSVAQDPRVGKLYADYADVEYFVTGDLSSALSHYERARAELNDTPSVRYRIGYIQYRNQDFEAAMNSFISVHAEVPNDRNLLLGLGNALFRRGDYYAAAGYLGTLIDDLDAERLRRGIVFPQIRLDHAAFVDTYMRASNNLAVALNRVSLRTGDSRKNARALALLAESARAWDSLTRNPETLVRLKDEFGNPVPSLANGNIQNLTHPRSGFETEIYPDNPRTLDGEIPFKEPALAP
jgi:tetratricopeptide (TPR) repeat protein